MENRTGNEAPPLKPATALAPVGADAGDGPDDPEIIPTVTQPDPPRDRAARPPQEDRTPTRDTSQPRSNPLLPLAILAVMLGLALLSLAVTLRL